jgi:DNA-binding NarL/FixJ family response regulator
MPGSRWETDKSAMLRGSSIIFSDETVKNQDIMSRKVIAYEDDADLRKQFESVFFSIRSEYLLLATFPHATGIRNELNHYQPDVVLMDLQMLEEDDGLVALYTIKQTHPNIKVLVLTMFEVDQKIFNALCLGADGYMLKSDFSSNQLPHIAIRQSLDTIFNGGAYLTPSVAKQILRLFTDQSIAERMKRVTARFQVIFQKDANRERWKEAGLTRMQTNVLEFIIDGMATAEIATILELSENTVNSHIKGIYATLGVHSRAMAIKKAMEHKGQR